VVVFFSAAAACFFFFHLHYVIFIHLTTKEPLGKKGKPFLYVEALLAFLDSLMDARKMKTKEQE
jgi:hypothetical protein